MSFEYERIAKLALEIPMELELKWVKTKLHERDNHILKLAEENSKLREDLREDIREGISLRDHFAGLAMQTLYLSNIKWEPTGDERDEESVDLLKELTHDAYHMADAMLAERERKND